MNRLRLAWLAALALGCGRYTRVVVPSDNAFESADVLVVPGVTLTDSGEAIGLLHNRVAMAKLLFDAGVAPRLLLTGGKPKNGVTEAARMAQIAVDLGIPFNRLILEPEADTTLQNGIYAAQTMTRLGLRSAVLVTDWIHLTYALPVFEEAFAEAGLAFSSMQVDNSRLAAAGLLRSYLGEEGATLERARTPEITAAIEEARLAAAEFRRSRGLPEHVAKSYALDEEAARARPNLLSYDLDLGLNATSGTTTALNLDFAGGVRGRWRDWGFLARTDVAVGRMRDTDGDLHVSALSTGTVLRGERRVAGDFFGFWESGAGLDRVRGIEGYGFMGAGMTWIWFEQLEATFERAGFRIDLGARVLREDRKLFYSVERELHDRTLVAPRVAVSMRYVPSRTVVLGEELEAMVDARRSDDFRAASTTSITAPLSIGLALSLRLRVRYQNDPPPTVTTTDTLTLVGLQWSY